MAVRRPGTAKVDFRRVKGRKGVLRVAKEGRYAIFENKKVFMSNILDVIIFWGTTP
jgi:hypothetical protein